MRASLGEDEPALQECLAATALLGKIAEDPANAQHRSNRAQAYEYLGYAYGALAVSPKASGGERSRRMSAARDMFQQSLNVLGDLRKRGILDAASEEWAQMIAGEIAKCDTVLSAQHQ